MGEKTVATGSPVKRLNFFEAIKNQKMSKQSSSLILMSSPISLHICEMEIPLRESLHKPWWSSSDSGWDHQKSATEVREKKGKNTRQKRMLWQMRTTIWKTLLEEFFRWRWVRSLRVQQKRKREKNQKATQKEEKSGRKEYDEWHCHRTSREKLNQKNGEQN